VLRLEDCENSRRDVQHVNLQNVHGSRRESALERYLRVDTAAAMSLVRICAEPDSSEIAAVQK
jgi:hypothetical protein